MKWKKTCCIKFFFVKIVVTSFSKWLNSSLDEDNLFLSHVKQVFFSDDSKWTEKNYTSVPF